MLGSYKVYLNPLQKRPKWSLPYSILGVIYIILGVLNYFAYNNSIFQGLIWVLGGLIFLIGGYYQTNFSSKYFFELNDQFVKLKDSITKAKTILWTNIKEIHIKPIAIEFHLIDNSKECISLGNVGYKNVLDIKEKLADFANRKVISIS